LQENDKKKRMIFGYYNRANACPKDRLILYSMKIKLENSTIDTNFMINN